MSWAPPNRLLSALFAIVMLTALGFFVLESDTAQHTSQLLQDMSECCHQQKSAPPTLACTPAPTAPAAPKPAVVNVHSALEAKLLKRLEDFKQQHIASGRPHAVGMRGVSWVHKHLNGALIASPDLLQSISNVDANGVLTIKFKDVSTAQKCPADMANLISIYVRLSGPELLAVLAQPVEGKCEWEARFQITISGEYTILARLLHYNGAMDITYDCDEEQSMKEAKNLVLLHKIPRYPYFVNKEDCAKMCTRYKECTHSIGFVNETGTWFTPQYCYLFTRAKKRGYSGEREILKHIGEWESDKRRDPFCRKTKPFTQQEWIWQLGCGRDEMLMRYAPCAGFADARRMLGVEDMILFEFEHSKLAITVSGGMSLDQAQREFDKPQLPICTAEQLAQNLDNGRWTRSPARRLTGCSVLSSFEASNFQTSPSIVARDDPLCALRFELDKLNQRNGAYGHFRWDQTHAFNEVWKTELSDSYFRTSLLEDNYAETWSGYFRLPRNANCAIPPLLSSKQIRQCIIDRNLEFYLRGDSIIEFFSHYFLAQIRAAFPEQEFPVRNRDIRPALNMSTNVENTTRVLVANFNAPNVATLMNLVQLESWFKSTLNDMLELKSDVSVLLTSPFVIWERRNGLSAPRMQRIFNLLRNLTVRDNGWKEIDTFRLSREWTMDSSPERDSLHVIGHTSVVAVQLLFHQLCAS